MSRSMRSDAAGWARQMQRVQLPLGIREEGLCLDSKDRGPFQARMEGRGSCWEDLAVAEHLCAWQALPPFTPALDMSLQEPDGPGVLGRAHPACLSWAQHISKDLLKRVSRMPLWAESHSKDRGPRAHPRGRREGSQEQPCLKGRWSLLRK